MYQATDCGPSLRSVVFRRAAISVIACSQVVRSNSPGPPLRRIGWITRSGSFWTPVMAIPLGQALPCERG